MNSSHPGWQRLVEAARRAPDERDAAAPYGFAVRVAALARAAERPIGSLFERFSLRAAGVAGLLALAAVAANFSSVRHLFERDAAAPAVSAVSDDPTATLVDLASS